MVFHGNLLLVFYIARLDNLDEKNLHRWVLLKHIGAPDDIKGIHFDLLLEDKDFCRTWRLTKLPQLDGPYVDAILIKPHKLEWLNIEEKVLSGNRGVATRIKNGIFFKALPSIEDLAINLLLTWDDRAVDFLIDERGCKMRKNSK